MPLEDLFSKAPNPLPPSEEPWPKPPIVSRQEAASSPMGSDHRVSHLYSATARPTLEEFLRTNYLMIPEFLAQVSQAKRATGSVVNEHSVQNMTSQQHSGLNFGDGSPVLNLSDRNQGVNYSSKRANDLDEKQTTVSLNGVELKPRNVANKLSAGISGRQISSDEKQPLVTPKPKQRVKKVMKGGLMVTIPAPQPRNNTLPGVDGSPNNKSKAVSSTVIPGRRESRKSVVDLSERKNLEESVGDSFHDHLIQAEMKGDLHKLPQSDGDFQEEVSMVESKQLQSEGLKEKYGQNSASLISKCSFHGLCLGKNNGIAISHDSSQDLSMSKASSNDKESDVLCNKDPQVAQNMKPDGKVQEKLTDDPTTLNGKIVSEAVAKECESNPDRKPASYKEDAQEPKINEEPIGEDDKGHRDYHDSLDPLEEANEDSTIINRTVDVPCDLHIMTLDQTSDQSDIEECHYTKESSDSKGTHVENDNHSSAGGVETPESITTVYKKDGCVVSGGDVLNTDVENNNAITTQANDNKQTSYYGGAVVNSSDLTALVRSIDVTENDEVTEGSNDVNNSVSEGHDVDHVENRDNVCIKENSSTEESDEDYAELVMNDSNSDDQEEGDFLNSPGHEDESDEAEGEVKSDYEPEDMNLDSDAESTVGGIIFYQDTALIESRKCARNKQRAKRKARNQRKKASKKRAREEKRAAIEKNTLGSVPSNKSKSDNEKQACAPTSQMSSLKEGPKNLGPKTQKLTETVSKPQTDTLADKNKPSGQGALEEGSLLSMVCSQAVDVTVAASEKLALKRSRGGQHAKKLKKAKRRAAALERIKRGEPPPRPPRVQQPKPLCNFYIQGKCRKGEECPFRHDKSAVVKKREMCKFYASNSCYLGNDCSFMHNSFPCKFFHTGSSCWEADRCKFSHDPLTEETSRLLRTVLNPPTEDRVEVAQDKNHGNVINDTKESQQIATAITCTGDTLQTSPSSPCNLRASTWKRRLSTNEAGDDHMTDEKNPRQDSEANVQGQSSLFLPGLYKDLSK